MTALHESTIATGELRPTYLEIDLDRLAEDLGYPLYMKPFDGGAWRGVSRINDRGDLHRAYDESGEMLMHLQATVDRDSGRVIVVSALDNLGKGAAGQAVQCANLMLGLPETAGLSAYGVAP